MGRERAGRAAKRPGFADFACERMAAWGEVRARAMFGGHGLYRGGTMFAIVADERLFLKTDALTRPAFAQRGLAPFTYRARGRTIALSYHEAPPELFEDEDVLRPWADAALGAALRGRRR